MNFFSLTICRIIHHLTQPSILVNHHIFSSTFHTFSIVTSDAHIRSLSFRPIIHIEFPLYRVAFCCPLILPLLLGSAVLRSDLEMGARDGRGRCVFVSRAEGRLSTRGISTRAIANYQYISKEQDQKDCRRKIIPFFYDTDTCSRFPS